MSGRKANQLNLIDDYSAFSRNYYALYVSITKNKTGKQSLREMGLLAE
jgi:hypothetical protein